MTYFLDTDICIYLLQGRFPVLKKILQNHDPRHIKIPAIVKAELSVGVEKSLNPKLALKNTELFLEPFEIVPFDDGCVKTYVYVRCFLEKKEMSIGAHDLLIASVVIAYQGVLVTHNMKEFNRIPDLEIEDWTRE